MNRKALGRRIKSTRLSLGLTQADLAEIIDVTTVYVGQIERSERNMTLSLLLKFSKALNVSVEYLLRDLTENNHQSKLQEISELITDLDPKELSRLMDIIKVYVGK